MAGTVVLSTLNDSSGVLATQNGMTGIAKAWVNFNGTGTVAIRDSFNVSSITDNGTGDYTVNFTTAMPNANYAAVGMTQHDTEMGVMIYGAHNGAPSMMTTTALRIATAQSNTRYDCTTICVAIFSS